MKTIFGDLKPGDSFLIGRCQEKSWKSENGIYSFVQDVIVLVKIKSIVKTWNDEFGLGDSITLRITRKYEHDQPNSVFSKKIEDIVTKMTETSVKFTKDFFEKKYTRTYIQIPPLDLEDYEDTSSEVTWDTVKFRYSNEIDIINNF